MVTTCKDPTCSQCSTRPYYLQAPRYALVDVGEDFLEAMSAARTEEEKAGLATQLCETLLGMKAWSVTQQVEELWSTASRSLWTGSGKDALDEVGAMKRVLEEEYGPSTKAPPPSPQPPPMPSFAEDAIPESLPTMTGQSMNNAQGFTQSKIPSTPAWMAPTLGPTFSMTRSNGGYPHLRVRFAPGQGSQAPSVMPSDGGAVQGNPSVLNGQPQWSHGTAHTADVKSYPPPSMPPPSLNTNRQHVRGYPFAPSSQGGVVPPFPHHSDYSKAVSLA